MLELAVLGGMVGLCSDVDRSRSRWRDQKKRSFPKGRGNLCSLLVSPYSSQSRVPPALLCVSEFLRLVRSVNQSLSVL